MYFSSYIAKIQLKNTSRLREARRTFELSKLDCIKLTLGPMVLNQCVGIKVIYYVTKKLFIYIVCIQSINIIRHYYVIMIYDMYT